MTPGGRWCSAETTPVAPVCRTASSEIGSCGPNQRQLSSKAYLLKPVSRFTMWFATRMLTRMVVCVILTGGREIGRAIDTDKA